MKPTFAPGAGRYPWPMARPTPAQRHRLIGEKGSGTFELTLPRQPSSHDLPHVTQASPDWDHGRYDHERRDHENEC